MSMRASSTMIVRAAAAPSTRSLFNNLLGGPYLTAEIWRHGGVTTKLFFLDPLDEFETALRERGYNCDRPATDDFKEVNCVGAYQHRTAHSAFNAGEQNAHLIL
eukprot:5278048-Amphidinium_carterae.1